MDNGPPFGGTGALGLSRLSVWWRRLGVQVEFTRRGCPQDNGAHEQMHRVLHAETARPPAATWAAQARRLRHFQRVYNQLRPHAALGLHPPQARYRPNPRRYAAPRPLRYAAGAQVWVVGANGKIFWAGRQRRIGEAFAGERIELRCAPRPAPESAELVQVYWGRQLIGELHASDQTGLRPAWYRPA